MSDSVKEHTTICRLTCSSCGFSKEQSLHSSKLVVDALTYVLFAFLHHKRVYCFHVFVFYSFRIFTRTVRAKFPCCVQAIIRWRFHQVKRIEFYRSVVNGSGTRVLINLVIYLITFCRTVCGYIFNFWLDICFNRPRSVVTANVI